MLAIRLFFISLLSFECSADAIPLLTSNLLSEGRTAACYGESVIFTCSILSGTGILQWAVESYHAIGYKPIYFTVYDHQVGEVFHDPSMLFNATLTQRFQDSTDLILGNLTSDLSVVSVSELDNKSIQCSDGVLRSSEAPKLTLRIGIPQPISAPQNVYYTVERFNIIDYLIKLIWDAPDIDGGVGISNYTITVTAMGTTKTVTTENMTANFELLYNSNYNFEIIAANCLGRSIPKLKTILHVSCGHPLPPANGTIETYSSTQEGSEIQFHCDEGHSPGEWITSQCQENGSWTPDPGQWNCTKHLPVDCGQPVSPLNGSVSVNSTTNGSYATFSCDQTLQPSHFGAICTSSAVWEPDPQSIICTQQDDCGIPSSPQNGTIKYTSTRVGTTLKIHCNPGFEIDGANVSICERDGWLPAPDSIRCVILRDQGQKNNADTVQSETTLQSPVIISGLAAAGAVSVLCLLGVIAGIIICYCRIKSFRHNKEQVRSDKDPVYEEIMTTKEDIELNKNLAYEVVLQHV